MCKSAASEEVENCEEKRCRGGSDRGGHSCYVPSEASADDEAVWHVQKADEACKDAGYQNVLSSKSPTTAAEAAECCKRKSKRQKTNAEAAQDLFRYS